MDWRNPDYISIYVERARRLQVIRSDPGHWWPLLFRRYADHPWELIQDWGTTYDPRNIERGIPARVPFILFPVQLEWLKWVHERWRNQEPGITDKSRDVGASWLAVSFGSAMCLTHRNFSVGFGSRKLEYVDTLGDPKSLFWKAREFLAGLPPELLQGWTRKHAPHKRIMFPGTNSTMTGEGGPSIGRGDRTSIYFVDEAAFVERPQGVDAALAATTNCRIDISSANGPNNPFAIKRQTYPAHLVRTLHWTDDPRKDNAWYQKQQLYLDAIVVASEIDINYSASVTGILIPPALVSACVDAHVKLGFGGGKRVAALDVADEGRDKNAWGYRDGVIVRYSEEWSGVGSTLFKTTERAFELCELHDIQRCKYDADGMGAGVRGDASEINGRRKVEHRITFDPFRGSGAVVDPDMPIETTQAVGEARRVDPGRVLRLNSDYYANAKAQAWWSLRLRCERTARCIEAGSLGPYTPDELISFDSTNPALPRLQRELSQPTYERPGGKLLVNKQPDNQASPNFGDKVMMLFAPETYDGYTLDQLREALK